MSSRADHLLRQDPDNAEALRDVRGDAGMWLRFARPLALVTTFVGVMIPGGSS